MTDAGDQRVFRTLPGRHLVGRHTAITVRPHHPRDLATSPRIRRLWWATVLAVLLISAALVRWTMLSGHPHGRNEPATAAASYRFGHLGDLDGPLFGSGDSVFARLQLGGYAAVSRTFDRHDSALAAVREPMLIASVVAGLLVWTLARRLGVGRVAAASAVAMLSIEPITAGIQRISLTENLAACWVLGSLTIAAGTSDRVRPTGRVLGSAACLSAGILTSTAAATAVPVVGWMLWRPNGDRAGRRVLHLVLATLSTLAAATALLAVLRSRLGSGSTLGEQTGTAIWDLVRLDPAAPFIAAVALIGAARLPRLGPLAVGAVGTLAAAAVPGIDLTGATAIVMPWGVLLIAAVGEDLFAQCRVQSSPRHRRPSRTRTLVPSAVLAALLLATIPAWAWGWGELTERSSSSAGRQAGQWLNDQVADPDVVVTDGATWVELTQAGLPSAAGRTDRCADCGSEWVVVTPALRTIQGDVTRRLVDDGVVVAEFGSGPDQVQVVRTGAPDPASEIRTRQAAGQVLVESTRITSDPGIRQLLADGRVDSRVLSALATLAVRDEVQVLDLPAVPGEDVADRPRRQLLLAVPGDGALTVEQIQEFFDVQRGPYVPEAVIPTPTGVLVRYSPIGPLDLLAPFAPPR